MTSTPTDRRIPWCGPIPPGATFLSWNCPCFDKIICHDHFGFSHRWRGVKILTRDQERTGPFSWCSLLGVMLVKFDACASKFWCGHQKIWRRPACVKTRTLIFACLLSFFFQSQIWVPPKGVGVPFTRPSVRPKNPGTTCAHCMRDKGFSHWWRCINVLTLCQNDPCIFYPGFDACVKNQSGPKFLTRTSNFCCRSVTNVKTLIDSRWFYSVASYGEDPWLDKCGPRSCVTSNFTKQSWCCAAC